MTQITLITLKCAVTIHKRCIYTIQICEGSGSRHEVKTTQLKELKMARFLRIKPTEWNGAIALRTEIYGCMRGEQRFNITELKRRMSFSEIVVKIRRLIASALT